MQSTQSLITHKPVKIDKIPACCPDPLSFQAGDIIIFNINLNHPHPQKHNTVAMQKLLNNTGGHKDAVHAAFIIEINDKKQMVHLRGNGFVLEEIAADSIRTVAHVYRPRIHQKEIAAELSQIVKENQDIFASQLKWKYSVTLSTFLRRFINALGVKDENPEARKLAHPETKPSPKDYISKKSICSKFLAQSYAASCYELSKQHPEHASYRHDLMNINTNTIPKTLQSYLYRCSNYDYFVMPHAEHRGQLTVNLLKRIQEEINHLHAKQKNDLITLKAENLQSILNQFEDNKEEKTPDIVADFNRAKALLKEVVPLLKINTGKNLKTPGSFTRVMDYASKQGLYAYYFENDLYFNSKSCDLLEEAKRYYGYDAKLAGLYSDYRQAGYSDVEARFECEPSFGKWVQLSPRRNTAAAVLVAPFLLVSVPLGLWRTHQADERKERLVEEKARALIFK